MIFECETLDHDRYIKEVLRVDLKYANDIFGDDWTFQRDGAKAHIHEKSQKCCAKNFPSFIGKDHWPPNNPDLNPLYYYVWREISQVIKRNAVTSKKTLIVALKRAVKKISNDVVFESCLSHELPNSTSNINDTHEAYFHFENKPHAVREGTHVILVRKAKV